MAHVIGAGREIMVDGNALVENETFAAPQAVFLWRFFKIVENAAFQMRDVFNAFLAQEGDRFFTTDAAGAVHGDAFDVMRAAKASKRLHITLPAFLRRQPFDAQRNDFFFQAHLHPVERIFIRVGYFDFQIGAAGEGFKAG